MTVPGDQRLADAHPEDVPGDHERLDTHMANVPGDQDGGGALEDPVPGDPGGRDAHAEPVPGDQGHHDAPMLIVPGDHYACDVHLDVVLGGHAPSDAQSGNAPGDHLLGDSHPDPVPGDHFLCGPHASSVPGDQDKRDAQAVTVPGDHIGIDAHRGGVPGDIAYEMLAFHSAMLDEAEHARIAAENRLRAMLDPEPRSGAKGIDPRLPEIAVVREVVERCQASEHQAELELVRSLRKHPLGGWVKRTVGVGEKQGARLLAVIGNPAWNMAKDRPRRGPAELWAYCGLHVVPAQANLDTQARCGGNGSHPGDHGSLDLHVVPVPGVAPRRQRGQKANWNAVARSRAFLVAESCKKQRHSPYREVYDKGREKYADAVHPTPCPPCGGKGDPLPVGSPLRPGHQDMRALRLVAKAILKDLWREARTLI